MYEYVLKRYYKFTTNLLRIVWLTFDPGLELTSFRTTQPRRLKDR